jgi:hypothetical protein
VTGQTVVETAVVMVTTLIDEAGQSGTSAEQETMVEVKVLKTVEVVIGTEVTIGVAGGAVGDSTVELVAGTESVSALDAGVLDAAGEDDSALVFAEDEAGATSVLVDPADVSTLEVVDAEPTSPVVSKPFEEVAGVEEVSAGGVGVDGGWQSNPTL